MADRDVAYNERVLECFSAPRHAGPLTPGGPVYSGRAQESAAGARVVLLCHSDGDHISEMRFSAWGCPHFIAAAEWLCRELESQPLAQLNEFDIRSVQRLLAVPVEKTGRILTLEDALEALKASLSQPKTQ